MPPLCCSFTEANALAVQLQHKMLAGMATWPTALTPQPAAPTLSPNAITTIAHGLVHVEPNWISPRLIREMRLDAQDLFAKGLFAPDGLTNTALKKKQQGFNVGDRQTFRNDAWDAAVGNQAARLEFAEQMRDLRAELARGLRRPTLAPEGVRKHEMTYNWYEPGAKLGRHLDEHHEETKGALGWLQPTRRSVTWLVYLNDDWDAKAEGGKLRCFPRTAPSDGMVGADAGNLQVGWLDETRPVFLDSDAQGGALLYARRGGGGRERLSRIFDVPPKPIDFSRFLAADARPRFEQISTARLDPRFAAADGSYSGAGGALALPPTLGAAPSDRYEEVSPAAGTLVLFDSVSMPHQVQPVTGKRQRVAATGWFHEDSQFSAAV